MRRGISPTRSRVIEEVGARQLQESRRITNPSINHWKYFCHYNNAVYQGGMSAYKKHGRGLLLHDDGAAVITQYLHDTPTGHNVIFRDNSIASVLFKSSSDYEIAYKMGKAIIKIPFTENSDNAHGAGLLIDYEALKIYQLVFKRGTLVDKILHLNRKGNEDAFKRATVARLMGLKHEQAFALTFEKPETMHVKQEGNELTVGYFDGDGQVHGLAFRMYGENVAVSGQKSLYLKSIERGYYKQSQLETFGEKYFSNGNKYVGEFSKGQFHGHGILVCPQQMKWVYGKFQNGKLSQVIDSNNKKFTQNEFQMWTQGLLDIHKRYRQRWIDFSIQLPDELYLYNTLKDALRKTVTQVDPDLQEAAKEDEYRMGRIQQQFQQGFPGDIDRSYVQAELDKHYTVRSSKTSRPFEAPRGRRNESPKNKHSIVIDDPPIREKNRIEETPISKLQQPKTQSKRSEEPSAQNNYRMQDPFQIELIKVPVEPTRREPIITPTNRRTPKDPIKIQEDLPRSNTAYTRPSPRYYQAVPRFEDPPRYYDEGIYRRTYLQQLEKQRQLYRKLEREDGDYIDYLRKGISRSPVHRDYYNTPPRYDPASKRYNGRIINKKVFNYEEPSSSSPYRSRNYPKEEERVSYSRDPSPPRATGNSPYRSSPRSKDSLNNSRSFIENNYKHWRS